MEEVYVIQGVRPYSFKDKDTGKLIEGATLHCVLQDTDDEDVIGVVVERLSVSKPVMQGLCTDGIASLIGLSISPVYNKKGRIKHVDVVSE